MAEWFTVTVTSQQRTSFGTGGERAYLTRTHPFLPGSVLRGALAAAWLRGGGTTDAEFRTIFERGRFSPAFPDWAQIQNQSVSRCKYHQDDAEHREYIDHAFPDPDAKNEDDTSCTAGREFLKGGCSRTGLLTQVSTALQPRKNTAAEGKLFAREMIEKDTAFTGHLVLPTGSDLGRLQKVEFAFFGGRSSVLGRCLVRIEHCEGPAMAASPADIVVRTLSPTILVDDAGLPSTDLAVAINGLIGAETVGQVWAGRVENGLVSGWHAASGLPKPAEIALASGAVAKLHNVDPDQVRKLLDTGLGLRRSEGYGWVEIAAKPWQPLIRVPNHRSVATRPGIREDDAEQWLAKITYLKLSPAQTRWFANQLNCIRAGQDARVDAALTEPGASGLSQAQRNGGDGCPGIKQLLSSIPDGIRNSVASSMRRGASR